MLRRAGDLWHANAEEITGWLMRETGAIGPFGGFQIMTSAEECYEAAALASAPYGELLRSMNPRLSMARRVPVGVVGVIAPFNVPTILSIRAVAPALALGNAVLLKPDPRTAVAGGAVLAEIFAQAGLPDGLLHVLPGGVDVGEALVTEPAVRVISFTGSTRAGRAVATLAAQHLKRVHLELGGNSALLILDDVDVDAASSVGAWGSFAHQGQVCMATGRHLVQAGVADDYIVGAGRPGRPPARRRPDAAGRSRSVRSSTPVSATGSTSSSPDRSRPVPGSPPAAPTRTSTTGRRCWPTCRSPHRPTPTRSSGRWRRSCGSTRSTTSCGWPADTPYGLSLGILTRDVMRGLEIAERIPTGLVHINDQTINDEATIPFGGVKDSGTGARLGGPQANLDAFTDTQWVTVRGHAAAVPDVAHLPGPDRCDGADHPRG